MLWSITSATDQAVKAIEDKGLVFACELPAAVPAAVHADEKRLRQVLVNLLDNAIKYTVRGRVALSVARHDGRYHFMVEDTGIGISAEELPRIFETFHQVRSAQAFAEGTGLGLAISKTLVALMGGSLEVSSKRADEEIRKARERAAELLAQAEKRGAQMIEEARNAAKDEGNREKAAAKAEIEQQVTRAREQLRDQVAALAVAGAEKILRREVDARSHAELLEAIKRQL